MARAQVLNAKGKPVSRFTEQQKKLLLGAAGVVVLIAGGWWAYFKFTTIPPPDLVAAGDKDIPAIASYLGNSRGWARLPVQQQEQFLLATYQKFSASESRAKVVQAMDRMSSSEREQLHRGIFGIGRVHVMDAARQYNNLPAADRPQFVDNAIRQFENMRMQLSGQKVAATPGTGGGVDSKQLDFGAPLKKDLPTSSDEMMKVIVTNTSADERAQAKPMIDALAERQKELKNPTVRRQFDAGGAKQVRG